jgi:hypothetical protein
MSALIAAQWIASAIRPVIQQNNAERPLQNGTICPISASGSNFNPRNILYIPVVEILAFLELEQKLPFFKGLSESLELTMVVCHIK